jgi:soluble lytic murein transglycosylase
MLTIFRDRLSMFPRLASSAILAFAVAATPAVQAKPRASYASPDAAFMALREAARDNDAQGAAAIAQQLSSYDVPSYIAYYQLKPRISSAPEAEIRDFLERYKGSAIADRLRNDWLLSLGYRRNWALFDEQYPLFVVNDDLQVKCYNLTSKALKGQKVAQDARALLQSPKDYGAPCADLIGTLLANGQFTEDDVWAQVRLAGETNNSAAARRIGALLHVPEKTLTQAIDLPALAIARGAGDDAKEHNVYLVALGRFAKTSHNLAALSLQRAEKKLGPAEEKIGWAQIALQASLSCCPKRWTTGSAPRMRRCRTRRSSGRCAWRCARATGSWCARPSRRCRRRCARTPPGPTGWRAR